MWARKKRKKKGIEVGEEVPGVVSRFLCEEARQAQRREWKRKKKEATHGTVDL